MCSRPVFATITYCLPAWFGFCTATDNNRLDSFLRRCVKRGFWATVCKTIRPMLSVRCLSVLSVLSVTFVHCGQTVGRPVLEYCVPVWHYALTKAQIEQIEGIQKRAIHIVLNFSRGMPYMVMLSAANLTTLASRREEMSRKFFFHISQPTSCLHHLLPDPRDHSVISRLRTYEKYPRVFTRTKRYCSFIQYALNHYIRVYQTSISNS